MSSYGAVDLSGTIASARGVAACRPRSLTVYGRSTQDGTPTPEAPAAIESVDELALWTAGRNLILPLGDWFTSTGYTVADGVLTKPTLSTASWTQARGINMPAGSIYGIELTVSLEHRSDTDFSTAGALTVNIEGSASYRGTRTKYARLGNNSNSPVPSAQWQRWSHTFTIPDESWFTSGSGAVDYIGVAIWSNTEYSYQIRNVQLELGPTATDYQPYASTSVNIDLDVHQLRSLPDGTRDELTVDSAGNVALVQRVGSVTFDGSSDETWTANTSRGNNIFYTPVTDRLGATLVQSNRFEQIASIGSITGTEGKIYTNHAVANQAFNFSLPSSVTSVALLRTWLAANPTEVIYPLATPVIHDLGTVELPLLPSDLTAWTVDVAEFEIRALLRTGHSPVMWDGEELSAGWVFVSDRHEQLLPRNVTTIDAPGRDGAIFGGVTQAVRQLTLSLYVLGRFDERAERVRELAARLAVDGPRPLRFGDDGPLYRMAVPEASATSSVYCNADGWTDVTFTCPDPRMYGETRQYVPTGSTLTFTLGGTAPTSPTITVTGATAGDGGFWRMVDETGAGIYAVLDSGTHNIVADCAARNITVDGSVVMLPPTFDWPVWAPGAHTVTITGGGSSVIQVQERWW